MASVPAGGVFIRRSRTLCRQIQHLLKEPFRTYHSPSSNTSNSLLGLTTMQDSAPLWFRIGKQQLDKKIILGDFIPVRHAGHSKWANIRHTKAAKDGEKSLRAGRTVSQIKIAIREGGGSDPRFNNQLARVIDSAQKADVAKSTIDNAIKNAITANKEGSLVLFEGKGPGNFALLIETFTDNQKRTALDIQYSYKKNGGQSAVKIAPAFFDHKGIIVVKPGGTLNTYEDVEEAAIVAEAEEIVEEPDEDEGSIFKVICEKETVYAVRKQMVADHPEAQIDNATFQYFPKPHSVVPLSGEALESAIKLVDALEKCPDVDRVYTNIGVAENS